MSNGIDKVESITVLNSILRHAKEDKLKRVLLSVTKSKTYNVKRRKTRTPFGMVAINSYHRMEDATVIMFFVEVEKLEAYVRKISPK